MVPEMQRLCGSVFVFFENSTSEGFFRAVSIYVKGLVFRGLFVQAGS